MLLSARMRSGAASDRTNGAAVMNADPRIKSSPRPAVARDEGIFVTLRRLVAGLGTLRPALVLLDVILGGRFEQRAHAILYGRDPVGDLDPFGAVQLLLVAGLVTVVVGAGHAGDRRREAGEPQFLPARVGNAERLEPAPHVLAGDHFLAGHLLGVADRLGDDHRVHHAAVVEVLAYLVLRGLALTLVAPGFYDVLDRRIIGAHAVDVEAEIALGVLARGPRVILVARPPDADEMIHRKVDLGGFLDGGGVHGAPAPHHHPVRLVAAHVEPQARLVLHLRWRHRVFLDLEA